jgi:large subunit ribosomal protein L18
MSRSSLARKRWDAKLTGRFRRKRRIRKKVFGFPERPRLTVFRSNSNIYAQIIDDISGTTLVAASTLDPKLKEWRGKKNIEAAHEVGLLLGKRALKKGIRKVVFDRSGYTYHGRVKSLADGAREGGLDF